MTGVDAVAVTGLLMVALGSAALTVAKHFCIAGSFHQTLAGGMPPAVSTPLRMDCVYPALLDTYASKSV